MLPGIHVKSCNIILQKDAPSFILSPCQFKMSEKVSENGGSKYLLGHKNHTFLNSKSDSKFDLTNWSAHERLITLISDESTSLQDEETSSSSISKEALLVLLRAWILAQLDAVMSFSKTELNSMVFGNKMLLQFQVKGIELAKHVKPHESRNGSFVRKRAEESAVDILYVLSVSEDSMRGGVAYEFEFSEGNKTSMNQRSLYFFLEKLHTGEGVPLSSVKERISDKRSNLEVSSLSWMGTTASDVTNSRYFSFNFLTPADNHDMHILLSYWLFQLIFRT